MCRSVVFASLLLVAASYASPVKLSFDETLVVQGTEAVSGFAVKELNEIVRKSTGRTYKTGTAASMSRRHIYVGRSKEVEKKLGADFLRDLKDEESVVMMKGNDLFLVGGGSLGSLWAVYDFVEDNLGYRWYWMRADGEKIEKHDTVRFRNGPTRRRPYFSGFRGLHNWHPGAYLFMVRNRSNLDVEKVAPEVKYKFTHRIPGHGFDFFLPRKGLFPPHMAPVSIETNMFRKHPEYFSLNAKGKRCDDMQVCFSNRDGRRRMIENFMLWVDKYGHGIYQVGQNDEHTGRFCHCEGCTAFEKKYNSNGGPLWDFVLELCDELKKRGRDDVYVTSLAYRNQTQICPENIEFPDNFIADCCPLTWDRSLKDMENVTLRDGRVYNYYENIVNWCKTAKHVSYWFYQLPSPMFLFGRALKELGDLREAGVESVGSCGCAGGSYEFRELSMYLTLRYLRDPDTDMTAELKAALAHRYGPAADEMFQYIGILDDARARLVKTNSSLQNDGAGPYDSMTFLSSAEITRAERLFDAAVEKTEGTKYADPVRFARVGVDFTLFFKADRVKKDCPDYAFDTDEVERRCRKAAEDCWNDPANHYSTRGKPHPKSRNRAVASLDDYANYKLLKSDELPLELGKYPESSVTRILPPKSRAEKRWWKPMGSDLPDVIYTSVKDPSAACGWAVSDVIPTNMTSTLSFGIYDWPRRTYMLGLQQVPVSFWEKDKYKMFCVGRSKFSHDTRFYVSDSKLHTDLGASPLYSKLLSRCFDGVYQEKMFEVWVSAKVQGPKFFPGDTRENRLFFEQFFVVDLESAEKGN